GSRRIRSQLTLLRVAFWPFYWPPSSTRQHFLIAANSKQIAPAPFTSTQRWRRWPLFFRTYSERILKRCIDVVAGLVIPAPVDKSAGEKIAVARIAEQVARELIIGEQIGFRADVKRPRGGS